MLAPLFVLAALAAAPAPQGRVLDRVAAVVNGEVVTLLELEERAGPDLRRAEALAPGPARERERARVLKETFDGVVSERLFQAQVVALGVEVSDAEIDSVIQDVKRRNGLDDERLDEALRGQGLDRAAYRKAVKRDLESMRLVQLKIRNKVKVTDEDVKNYWQTHPQEFRAGEEVRARHIFLPLAPDAVAAEVARELSQGPSAREGGELGWLKRGTVQADVEKVAFVLQPGEVSGLIRTRPGYQIIQVEERRGGGARPFEEVKDEVRDRLVNEQGDVYRAQYVAELRKDAVIEVKIPELKD